MFHISYSRNSPPQIVNSYVICPLRFSFSYFWKKNLKRETLEEIPRLRMGCWKTPIKGFFLPHRMLYLDFRSRLGVIVYIHVCICVRVWGKKRKKFQDDEWGVEKHRQRVFFLPHRMLYLFFLSSVDFRWCDRIYMHVYVFVKKEKWKRIPR